MMDGRTIKKATQRSRRACAIATASHP